MSNQQSKNNSIRFKVYQLLESETKSSIIAKIVTWLLIFLIISNVAATILASEPDYYLLYKDYFVVFEVISLSIFFFEYLLRVWCCVEAEEYQGLSKFKSRIKYIITPIALIDLIAVLPFLIAMFFSIDLRSLRLIRVLRLLKLTHYFKGFNIFITVIVKESQSIAAAVMVMLFLIIIAASLIHSVEATAQPEFFGSIIQSFWWAIVTMTTVGYGDVVPITSAGKVIASFIMVIGVGLVALPAAMLAGRFSEELRERKEDLDSHIKGALTDGKININEFKELEALADRLEIEPEVLQRSISLLKQGGPGKKCPHCGK
jgi:voltage-gated potassium channel